MRNINPWIHVVASFPKKRRLGPQNGSRSLGLEKLLKILNYAKIKETEELKGTIVGVQVGSASGHQHPLGSIKVENVIHIM